MTSKDLPWSPAPLEPQRTRRLAASALRGASVALGQWARRLRPVGRHPATDPVLEFYAEAGAPEGALYVDGQLVGRVQGVTRL